MVLFVEEWDGRSEGDRFENTLEPLDDYLDLTLSPNTEKTIVMTGSSDAAATIQSGLAGAVPGDKFRVTGTAGTYPWTTTVYGVGNGAVDDWITLHVDAGIDFELTGAHHAINLADKQYWQVANFRIVKTDPAVTTGSDVGVYCGGFWNGGWSIANSLTVAGHHYRVVGNEITGMCGGISGSFGLGEYFFAGNTVTDCAWYQPGGGSGIDITGNYRNVSNPNQAGADADPIVAGFPVTVIGNRCTGNRQYIGSSVIGQPTNYSDGSGIIIGDHNPGVFGFHQGPFLVANNVCWLNGGRAINPFLSPNITIENNTCWHNFQHGIDTNASGPGNITDPGYGCEIGTNQCPNVTIRNNYMEADTAVNWLSPPNRTRHCFQTLDGPANFNAACGNNYKVNPSTDTYEYDFGSDIDGTSQLVSTAAGSEDFRFVESSALLDAGSGTPAYGTDHAGNTRVVGTVDIGAYELAAGT